MSAIRGIGRAAKEWDLSNTPSLISEHAPKGFPLGLRDSAEPFATGIEFDELASRLARKLEREGRGNRGYYQPVAICGSWGSGKTSFLYRLANKLDAEATVFFDTWMFDSRQGLVEQFFVELAELFPNEIALQIWDYADLLLNLLKADALKVVSPRASAAGKAMGVIGDKLRGGGVYDRLRALRVQKDRVVEALSRQDYGMRVIIIDDVDRLRPKEIKQLFRFVGSVVDFPRIQYIIAYDEERVLQAFGERGDRSKSRTTAKEDEAEMPSRASYVDKIVRLKINLPAVSLERLIGSEFGIEGESDEAHELRAALARLFPDPRKMQEAAIRYRVHDIMIVEPLLPNAPICDVCGALLLKGFWDKLKTHFSEHRPKLEEILDKASRYYQLVGGAVSRISANASRGGDSQSGWATDNDGDMGNKPQMNYVVENQQQDQHANLNELDSSGSQNERDGILREFVKACDEKLWDSSNRTEDSIKKACDHFRKSLLPDSGNAFDPNFSPKEDLTICWMIFQIATIERRYWHQIRNLDGSASQSFQGVWYSSQSL